MLGASEGLCLGLGPTRKLGPREPQGSPFLSSSVILSVTSNRCYFIIKPSGFFYLFHGELRTGSDFRSTKFEVIYAKRNDIPIILIYPIPPSLCWKLSTEVASRLRS